MKNKKLMLSVLSALIISGSACATTFAASNDELYADVPTDHWAYSAVQQLAQDGIVNGYGDGTFRGDRTITRYEMAQMVANARTNEKKASDADRALIEKLSKEFSDDLTALGVRVSNVEKKQDNVKLGGVFCNKAMKGINNKAHTWWEKELFLNIDGNVGDGWNMHGGLDWKWGSSAGWNREKTFSDAYGNENKDVNAMIYNLYAKGPIGKDLNTTIGLFAPDLQSGVVGNARVKGVEASYNIGKTAIKAYTGIVCEKNGDLSSKGDSDASGFTRNGGHYDFYNGSGTTPYGKTYKDANDTDVKATGFSVEQQFNNKTAAGIGYYKYDSPNAYGNDKLGIWAINASQKLNDKFELTGFYSHGDQGYQNKAYDLKLVYNGSPWGSNKWGASVGYRYLGSDAVIMSSIVNGSEKPGSKGMEATIWYHFTNHIQLQNYFFFGKAIDKVGAAKDADHTAFFSNLIFNF
jgi:hypothetical protein